MTDAPALLPGFASSLILGKFSACRYHLETPQQRKALLFSATVPDGGLQRVEGQWHPLHTDWDSTEGEGLLQGCGDSTATATPCTSPQADTHPCPITEMWETALWAGALNNFVQAETAATKESQSPWVARATAGQGKDGERERERGSHPASHQCQDRNDSSPLGNTSSGWALS